MDDQLVQNEYHTEISSCFYDCSTCFYGFFCPCCLNASNIAALRRENCTICHCICYFSPFWVRQMVQEESHIKGSFCANCVLTTFCYSCAICQDSREINWKRKYPNNTDYN